MKSSIAKYVLGAVVIAAIAAYAIFNADNNNGTAAAIPPASATPSTSTTASGSATSSGAAGNPPSSITVSLGQYKDGTYTGTVADAFYGQLQVVVTIANGKITNVTFPVYPNEPGHTTDVSQQDLPILAQEAISAQSANVNVVSGATQDSQAFQQSLASALAQA